MGERKERSEMRVIQRERWQTVGERIEREVAERKNKEIKDCKKFIRFILCE